MVVIQCLPLSPSIQSGRTSALLNASPVTRSFSDVSRYWTVSIADLHQRSGKPRQDIPDPPRVLCKSPAVACPPRGEQGTDPCRPSFWPTGPTWGNTEPMTPSHLAQRVLGRMMSNLPENIGETSCCATSSTYLAPANLEASRAIPASFRTCRVVPTSHWYIGRRVTHGVVISVL